MSDPKSQSSMCAKRDKLTFHRCREQKEGGGEELLALVSGISCMMGDDAASCSLIYEYIHPHTHAIFSYCQ